MFKKTKVRSILELLGKGLSARLVAKTLNVSRNTVSEVQTLYEASGKTWDEISCWDDDMLYALFYPEKFRFKHTYVSVDYSYVHKELMKTGVTEMLLWEEYKSECRKNGGKACSYLTFTRNYRKYVVARNYTSRVAHRPGVSVEVDWSGPTMSFTDPDTGRTTTAYLFVATMPYSQKSYVEATADMKEKSWLSCHVHMFEFYGGTPLKIVCDNLKTGVTSHPANGDIMLNESYLALGEYYSVAIFPAGVKKPKHKASVEGSVGMIASAIIARLRNESFSSLASLNAGIRRALDDFNDKPFQKRQGNRSTVFAVDEKPCLKPLPAYPYEVCEWSYGHKVGPNSHIWWRRGQYSVPFSLIDHKVDVKFNEHMLFIYHDRVEVARHERLPRHAKNAMSTDPKHLPMPPKEDATPESTLDRARDIGPKTFEVLHRMFDEAKVREQPLQAALSILALSKSYSPSILEKACAISLVRYHLPFYGTILAQARRLKERGDYERFRGENMKTGIVRGADYYKKEADR